RLASGKEGAALDALVVLAQNVLASKAPWPTPPGMSVDNIVEGLEKHPLAKPPHELLAVDLTLHQHPEQRDEPEQAALTQWKADDSRRIRLKKWRLRCRRRGL